jgi:DNA-binding response OmpR family regulator
MGTMRKRYKILIVDDEPFNVEYLKQELEDLGYQTVNAATGLGALLKAATEAPDLILLDVMMPDMDGFTVCRILKEQQETQLIPVVIMTALGHREDRIKGIEAGADDFLTKPVNLDELMARVRTALQMRQKIKDQVSLLQSMQQHLSKFVPQSVKRLIEENPETPALETREKDVSVLFIDISGYARLIDTLAHEQVNAIVERYFSRFLDCIYENGGEINGTSGDGLMTTFADVDPYCHARKGVKSALAILRGTAKLNEQLPEQLEPIVVHMGIDSGLALVGSTKLEGKSGTHWTYTATGAVPNVAARLAQLAVGGMILISAETARRVTGHFSLMALGKKPLKNIKEEILVYQVCGEADALEN